MGDLKVHSTATPSESDLNSFIELLSTSFNKVPLTTALITEIDGVSLGSPSQPLSPDRLRKHFGLGLPALFKSNVRLTTVTSSSSELPLAAVLLEPPDFSGLPPSHARKQPGPILREYRLAAQMFKSKHLEMPNTGPHQYDTPASPSQASAAPSEDPYPTTYNKNVEVELRTFYHLSFLVKNNAAEPAKVQQAVKLAIAPYLEKAREDDVPILLEASSKEARDEFQSLGFKDVDSLVVGHKRVSEVGWPTDGGAGVKIWAMIYNK